MNTQAETTVTGYRIMVRHLTGLIGTVKLTELKVRDVDFALSKLAERLSTRSVRLARMILTQAIRNAMVNDLVVRNASTRKTEVVIGVSEANAGPLACHDSYQWDNNADEQRK